MLIGIYFILRDIILKNQSGIWSVITLIGTLLIIGFGLSMMGNALTGNTHSTDSYTRRVHSLGGRIIRAILRGGWQLIRFVFYIAPHWVYRNVTELLQNAHPVVRLIVAVFSYILTILLLI